MLAIAAILTGFFVQVSDISAQDSPEEAIVYVVKMDAVIDRVSERYLLRHIETAEESGYELIVILLDTPGGLLDATRGMVEEILGSEVPVVVYVSPSGAQAASAGTFISAAAGFLAMSPGTNIGAASPVGAGGMDLDSTLADKVKEDTAAFIRSIAEVRGRNVTALADTVNSATSFSANEAVENGIADGIFDDLEGLLSALDGMRIPTTSGKSVVVTTSSAEVQHVDRGFFDRVLGLISDPNVAFLLVSLGGLALTIEIFNFGTWFPGIAGVLMLAVGFAGVGFLPFSWSGIALIGLAIALFVAEAYAPGFGFFGITGALSLALGGLFLFGFFGTPGLPGFSIAVNRWLLVGIGTVVGLIVLWIAWEVRRSRKRSAYQNEYSTSEIVGKIGTVTTLLNPRGQVFLSGEYWGADLEGTDRAEVDEQVEVVEISGLTLIVRKAESSEKSHIGDQL